MSVKNVKLSRYYHWSVKIFLSAGCFLQSGFLMAQQPVVKASVDRNQIVIGDQFRYQVSVTMPDNTY
ncbi:MAG: hypothetical protein KGM98_00585, partial [Bacteroidota bacterium]|nr:hypothetical protein [Bacteroidota bacterium]